MINTHNINRAFIIEQLETLTDEIPHITPVDYNQETRYLPRSVSRYSGYMDFELTPHWIEPLNCMDTFSDAREVAIKKGVQIGYNTAGIESGLFYVAGHLRSFPSMFASADKELANGRVEANLIPMFQQSGLDIFQSADMDNTRKTGKTKNHLQWRGGGFMVPAGAKNADKMRSWSIMYLFLDEVDAWADIVGKDGDPIKLFKDRCSAFWEARKIMMGSTPLLKGASHIDRQFERGDQRVYKCKCLKCGHPQSLRWSREDDKGNKAGFLWDYKDGRLDPESVRYRCYKCGHDHYEHDKDKFINKNNSKWIPTAQPVEVGLRSYHMPAMISKVQPWHKCVSGWLDAHGKNGKVRDVGALQLFYNNILGASFELVGAKVAFNVASSHRRGFYQKGQIPNKEIEKYCNSGIMFLTCAVDVHKNNLAVSVIGTTIGGNTFLIDYKRVTDDSVIGLESPESPAWQELQRMIDEQTYKADDGKIYPIGITLIDSGYLEAVVSNFCAQWESGVYAIKGVASSSKRTKEFTEFKTSVGQIAYLITVDYYKDRLAPILRRQWAPDEGNQGTFQFNAPVDTTDKEIKELTREYKKEIKQKNGMIKRVWWRPNGADNELWDLLVYTNASLDILAYKICTENLGEDETDFQLFWEYLEEQQLFYNVE